MSTVTIFVLRLVCPSLYARFMSATADFLPSIGRNVKSLSLRTSEA